MVTISKFHCDLFIKSNNLLNFSVMVLQTEFKIYKIKFSPRFSVRGCEWKSVWRIFKPFSCAWRSYIIIASWGRSAACKTNKRRQSTDGRAGRSNLCRVRRTSGDTLFRSHELAFCRSRLPHGDNYSQRRLHFNFRKRWLLMQSFKLTSIFTQA
jgi:hypothetical protein